jgi:chromosome segregation ATPase
MKIINRDSFMNVLPFDAIALPDLLVIVGLNGSGKSQTVSQAIRFFKRTDSNHRMMGSFEWAS